jgi:hypothetical protein
MSVLDRFIRRKICWDIWGTKIEYLSPRRPCVDDMSLPSKLNLPGQESFSFYDSYFDKSLHLRYDISAELRESIEFPSFENSQSVFYKRQRFSGEWRYGRDLGSYSFVVQGIVYRDTEGGSFFDPGNLKRAHLRHCESEYKDSNKKYEDWLNNATSMIYFRPGFTALRWRQREVSGQCWQGYDTFNFRCKTGEVWVFPLGDDHYMAIQLSLRCVHQVFQEYLEKFDRFIESFFDSLNVTYSSALTSNNHAGTTLETSEADVYPAALGYKQDDLTEWQELNSDEGQLNRNLSLASLKQDQLFRLKQNLIMPGLLVMLFTVLLGVWGGRDALSWLVTKGFPLPSLYFFLGFAYLAIREKIHKMLQGLKEALEG